MSSDYDVIVVGGGSPGEHRAGALADGGLHVAIVERELVGGSCSYYACIPSKTLLRPGEAVHAARDLANMMLCLALRSSAERVYQRALPFFSTAEISEAFAAAHGLALPSQLRHEIRASGGELHEEFLRLLPRRPAPVRIQRWSTRRVASSAAVLAAVVLLGFALANVLVNDTTQPSALLVTNMGCQALEPLLAEAQSVPTATEVVCIRSLPTGWSLGRVEALRGTSVITLDNDRAGRGA